jgi:hypothetical protein
MNPWLKSIVKVLIVLRLYFENHGVAKEIIFVPK